MSKLCILACIGLFASTIIGDYSSKQLTIHSTPWRWVTVFLAYNFATAFWLLLLREVGHLGRAGLIWGLTSTIFLVCLSHFIFQEPMTTKQWIGVGLGLGALSLLL